MSEERRKREVLGITSSQTEILEELSEGELEELKTMKFEERRNYLDEVRSLIEGGTRERKKPKEPPQEDLGEKLKKEQRRHWLEEEKQRRGWRFQYERAEELAKEKRKRDKKNEIEKKFGKGTTALVNPPLRREKVISLNEKEDEEHEKSVLFFHEPPPKKVRYKIYRRKKEGE